MTKDQDSYIKAIREVSGLIQVLIYRRETSPIIDREEVEEDMERRVKELGTRVGNGKPQWRKRLLELAAYAVFAAIADE